MATANIEDHRYSTNERSPSFLFSQSGDHDYSIRKTPSKKRKRICSTPTGKTPTQTQKKLQKTSSDSLIGGQRSKWSIDEKKFLQQLVVTSSPEDSESDNSFWARCAKTVNLRFPDSMRTGASCRNAYNRLSIDPCLELNGKKSSPQATRNMETQTEMSLINRQRCEHSQTEGEWVFWEPKKELKDDPSETAKAINDVAVQRLREYADINHTEKARLVDIIWTGSSKQTAREILSSSLGHQIKTLILQDTELEAKDCASRHSVLHHKQYKNLKEFNWEEVVNEMIEKQTFLTEILLAVSFPTGKIGSTTATEAIVPVLGCVYGMLMKQRFHELSRLQRVISMALANEQTAQKVLIEIS